jgi:sterol desaturase/sphingolipid hydroxylase (fatty acid hydroxylase superfamily)
MVYAFELIFAGAIGLTYIERKFPARDNPVRRWYIIAIFFNLMQLLPTVLGHYTWEHYLVNHESLFKLNLSPFIGGLFAYLISSWIFYWWHRIRHDRRWVWLIFHQLHHSQKPIVLLDSFFKHPFEIIINSIIITVLVFPILGLSVEANAWLTIFSAYGEFFYHLNIKTPRFIGYFIQRPESHCLHHRLDSISSSKCPNLADIPLWDILGATYWNPTEDDMCDTGFSGGNDTRFMDMIFCRNVLTKDGKQLDWSSPIQLITNWFSFIQKNWKNIGREILILVVLLVGSLSIIGYVAQSPQIRGVGFMTTASPLPFVFSSFNGIETFSTEFELHIFHSNLTHVDNTADTIIKMDHKLYGRLRGPYNWLNMYGAVFSHGPFFSQDYHIKMRDQILKSAMCGEASLARRFGLTKQIEKVEVITTSKTVGNEGKSWSMSVTC